MTQNPINALKKENYDTKHMNSTQILFNKSKILEHFKIKNIKNDLYLVIYQISIIHI